MPLPSKATISAVIGPGKSVSSLVLNDVRRFEYDIQAQTINVLTNDRKVTVLDAANISTVTHTVSSGQHTITIS